MASELTAGMTARGRTVIHATQTLAGLPNASLCGPFGAPITRPRPEATPTCFHCLVLLAGYWPATAIPAAWREAVEDAKQYV